MNAVRSPEKKLPPGSCSPTLAATITALRKCLREDFNVDDCWVGIVAGALKRHDI